MRVTITLTNEKQTRLRALSASRNKQGLSAGVEQVVEWFLAETASPDAWLRMALALSDHAGSGTSDSLAKRTSIELSPPCSEALRKLATYRGETRCSVLVQDAVDWYLLACPSQDIPTAAAGRHTGKRQSVDENPDPPPAPVYRCYILKREELGDREAIVGRTEAALAASSQALGAPFLHVGEDDASAYRSVIWRLSGTQHVEVHLVDQGAGYYLMTAAQTAAEAERIAALLTAMIPCYTVAELVAKARAMCEQQPTWLPLLAIATNGQFDEDVLKILEAQLHSRQGECRREAALATSHLLRWPQLGPVLRSARRVERDPGIISMLDFQILLFQ